ncbi:MAG: hypothetical protein ACREGE_01250 [Candidatus Microsaccharimonas sp.]
MNITELMNIVHAEKLDAPILYSKGTSTPDAVVLEHNTEGFRVYITDERAAMFESTLKVFDNESDAFEHVLLKLRQSQKMNDAFDSLAQHRKKPTPPTHVQQVNGSSRSALLDSMRPYPEQIRFTLNQMNGTSFWAYSVWRAPKGADVVEDTPLSEEYIQCIGSAEAMILEVRTLDPDDPSVAYQFTIGKPGDYSGRPLETLIWDNGRRSMKVYSGEVFTADEAATVFYTYFESNGVTRFYNLRELDL